MPLNHKFSVVVPAAGIGQRMNSEVPKQYLTIAGKTIIEHTIDKLLAHPAINNVVVVLHPNDSLFNTLAIANNSRVQTTVGGDERADSVLAGLQHIPKDNKWVLVHDAARPCFHLEDLSRLIELAKNGEVGGVLATPVRDTMKRSNEDNLVLHTEQRINLWHALTPQFFMLEKLNSALLQAKAKNADITDEASAMEFANEKVILVIGNSSNIKVTQPEDLLLAEFYLTQIAKQSKSNKRDTK